MRTGVFVRSFGSLVALTTCTFAFFRASTPSDPAADELGFVPSQIDCQGTACGGNGGPVPRRWSYWVQPGFGGVNRVDMGVHSPLVFLGNKVLPPGWTVQVLEDSIADDLPFTAHGHVTPQLGPDGCGWVLRWSGPTMTVPFQLGYGSNLGVHEVEWDTSDGGVADWSKKVGKGEGPIHSPTLGIVPIPVD